MFIKGRLKKKKIENERFKREVREIDNQVLEWFKTKWYTVYSEEKKWFYDWLKSNYEEHLSECTKNKNSYFDNYDKQNIFEAVSSVIKFLGIILGYVISYILGSQIISLDVIFQNINLSQTEIKIVKIAVFILGIFFILSLAVLVYIVFYSSYIKKENKLKQEKETWIRHSEAIEAYQKEMIGYIFDLDEYGKCRLQSESEKLLMTNIRTAWVQDMNRFQANMSREKAEKKNTK